LNGVYTCFLSQMGKKANCNSLFCVHRK
jgi:hypothetical protein